MQKTASIFFRFLLVLLFIWKLTPADSQLVGSIHLANGEPLPFASIYLQSTSQGTTTNQDGKFVLPLEDGQYTIVIQYIGFQTQIMEVDLSGSSAEIDVTMVPEIYKLDEVVIRGEGEDPAYEIIRKAIEKRPYYLKHINAYSCEVYIKGNQKLLAAPKSILGQEIGDLDGALDSSRQGIVYLSESVANYYYMAPNHRKEIMISSKTSGNDRGYSFNSATEMEVNFYENTIDFNRPLVSPIADNALNYYQYELMGASLDGKGRLINKIKVIPKRKYDPVVKGVIYIVEDQWNLQSVDLYTSTEATQLYFLDSLNVKQIYIPLEDHWVLFSNAISFKVTLFGFDLRGQFTGMYRNYNLSPGLENKFFGSDILEVQKESNQRDDAYWEEMRPVPLLEEENRDYLRRDSIRTIRESPEYLDSVDREKNQFQISNVLGGYSFQNRNSHLYLNLRSPLSQLSFNTVEGFKIKISGRLLKYFDEEETKRVLLWADFTYGFSDHQLRPKIRWDYRPDRLSNFRVGMEFGREVVQFNSPEAISNSWNTIYSLGLRKNYMKLYERDYIGVNASKELWNGISFRGNIRYANRKALLNHSDYSFRDISVNGYTSNDPQNINNHNIPSFNTHHVFQFEFGIRFRPGQKYYRYPHRRFPVENKAPIFSMQYRSGIAFKESQTEYMALEFGVEQRISNGVSGDWMYYVNTGTFLKKRKVYFMDYRHFSGQQITFGHPNRYDKSFLLLPYYEFSTINSYLQLHTSYKFKGWILDRIPVLNKLGWQLSPSAKFLYAKDNPTYFEASIGIDHIGIHFFRLLRFDIVTSWIGGNYEELGFRIGLRI